MTPEPPQTEDPEAPGEGGDAGPRLKPNLLSALKELGLMGAVDSYIHLRSGELGDALGLSQQSASNLLVSLEGEGLVERQMGAKGQRVKVTDAGLDRLRREHGDYHSIFDRPVSFSIRGRVMTGLGEGKYYIGQAGYVEQFRDRLGFEPEHGTLNLTLDEEGMAQMARVRDEADVVLEGFEHQGRTFGAVKCTRCTINGTECAVIVPVRTHHRNVMEVVCQQHLRDKFRLEDGDEVEVVVKRE